MTNDPPMTKEWRSPKDETGPVLRYSAFGHSDFLHHWWVIRHWSFPKGQIVFFCCPMARHRLADGLPPVRSATARTYRRVRSNPMTWVAGPAVTFGNVAPVMFDQNTPSAECS